MQIDWWDREAWFVQDHATGTVRAYTDPSGEVVEQYGFDAFGNLIRRDAFALAQSGSLGYYHSFRQRLGHQGLFADRLDAHTAARVIEPGVEAWYQSRSRWYAPELGRFVTADPNGTGVPVQASLAMHGVMASGPPSGSFGWESHYGDGWDVFTAYGANPVRAQDPTGLFFMNMFAGASGVGNMLNTTTADFGMNTISGVEMLSGGVAYQQVALGIMADSLLAGFGGPAFDVALGTSTRMLQSLSFGLQSTSNLASFAVGLTSSTRASLQRLTDIPFSTGRLRQIAKDIRDGYTTTARVQNRSQAEELLHAMYTGLGYRNTTGMTATQVRKVYGTKKGTYHWDDLLTESGTVAGHGPGNPHSGRPHLQIHDMDGRVIRIEW